MVSLDGQFNCLDSGRDDNDFPSFFGHSSSPQDSALTILQGILKEATLEKFSAPSPFSPNL
jgi:hypothetical protein